MSYSLLAMFDWLKAKQNVMSFCISFSSEIEYSKPVTSICQAGPELHLLDAMGERTKS